MITSGQQWSTGLIDQIGTASIAEEIGEALVDGTRLSDISGFTQIKVGKDSIVSFSRPLISVSASNLKKTLVDMGYISASQAGL
jgi:ABC-type xylose transport system substrate-binding protein